MTESAARFRQEKSQNARRTDGKSYFEEIFGKIFKTACLNEFFML